MDFANHLEIAFEKETIVGASFNVIHSLQLYEKDRMISRLERDLSKAHAEINALKTEKARIVKEKDEKIESLKKEIESAKKVSIQKVEHIIVATQNNTEHEYSTPADNHRTVLNLKGESSPLKVDSSKSSVVKKKSTKKHKDMDVSSIAYNLRSRTIVKSNETIGNKYSM